jgi:hypothetical protein
MNNVVVLKHISKGGNEWEIKTFFCSKSKTYDSHAKRKIDNHVIKNPKKYFCRATSQKKLEVKILGLETSEKVNLFL